MDDKEELERRVGTTLRGKWTLERLIGVGGMAAVYVGRHEIGRREAIKILHSAFAKDKDLRKRFEREAQAANRFRHPGAVEIHDMDIAEDGAPFLVMELLEGESMASRAERGPMPIADVLRYVDELLDVLTAAHAEGIIHRDIKPDNLFILKDGRLKVLDFGIARMRQGAPSSLYTQAGALLGTLSYMPPEQILGESIDARADLFAVGATMFRLVARRRMHEANSETDMVVKMATLAAPRLASVVPGAPPHVALIVDRALAFAKEDRYPEASTMQADVRAVRDGREPPHAARLAALGLDPGQGAPTAGAPPPSALMDPTRVGPPPTRDEAMGPPSVVVRSDRGFPGQTVAGSHAAGPMSSDAATIVGARVGGDPATAAWVPRPLTAAGEKRPPWIWIGGGVALLLVIGVVVGFSCSGDPPPREGPPGQPAADDPPHGMRKMPGKRPHPRR